MVADAAAAVEQLLQALEGRTLRSVSTSWARDLRSASKRNEEGLATAMALDDVPINPYRLVRELRAAAREANPGIELSAAVWTYADRAYLSQGQDWRGWIEDGLIELAVPMTYTLDERILRYHAEDAARSSASKRIWLGLGSWLFAKNPERAVAQVETVRALGVAGLSYFSWDAIADNPALRAALVAEATGGR